ncbi:hypothetical protein [Streptomyces sp. RFCAC02]|uniref:hypothetical protein n=1 Tax=Streptomyces sp. RFCAC02 TaxID=2499143 RepID=UPI001020EFB6|nr:hypothetical protein [Streptomyces sp. RFCAC02]
MPYSVVRGEQQNRHRSSGGLQVRIDNEKFPVWAESKEGEMEDFTPPVKRVRDFEKLFTSKARRRVQSPAETYEYKKTSGSSDGAKTYDTTAV